jgi:hypothetical protein
MKQVTSEAAQSQWIDLADLSSLVASTSGADRKIDAIVDAMLAGPKVIHKLTMSQLRDSQWLSDETLEYTRGGAPLRVLLQRRGLKARTWASEDVVTTSVSDISGNSKQATGDDEVTSTLLAVILYETTRQS